MPNPAHHPPLRVVFFGTPEFATPSLRALLAAPPELAEVVAVVTQPDRRVGRGRRTAAPPPVKSLIESTAPNVPVHQPHTLKELRPELESLAPDVAVVVAYGKIFRRWLLELPRLGCLNVHASILPALRGPAPIRWAVIRGLTSTGVSIMRLERGVDTGPVMRAASLDIGSRESAEELTSRIAELGATTLLGCFPELAAGTARFEPQDDASASHAPLLTKDDGRIDWSTSAVDIDRLARGATPWPLAWSPTPKGPLKLLDVEIAGPEWPEADKPGAIVALSDGYPVVACGEGALIIRRIQPPGARAMTGREAVNGRRIRVGDALSEG